VPEDLGGVRNWDYRYCWLRDATFTLYAMIAGGYHDEARSWRDWLLRAVAGDPAQIQIMYGVSGERRLPELELPWLPGYEASAPVRIGNAAAQQLQLDVFGEVLDLLHQTRTIESIGDDPSWDLEVALLEFLEGAWSQPDEGLWEVRGERQHFTHSKVMAWVGFDRAVKAVDRFGLEGPVDRWRAARDSVRAEVLEKGWDADQGSFTQVFGSSNLDASSLLIPLVGFLPPSDERVHGTIAAIQRQLMHDGFVRRYLTEETDDGLPGGDGAFLACSFWLADNLALVGRRAEARDLFERLSGIANDVGLLAEEYDPVRKRMIGNFPQAFSHVGLINTALNLAETGDAPAGRRASS
jgi:GH15 family glucan-1,4-alpha-glucosidase